VKNGVPDIDWVSVSPGGSVDIGGTQKKVEPFYLARYPVTYAQYEAFVAASDGFQDPQWWRDMDPDHCPPGTGLSDQVNQLSNAPREGVSWYQAVAFTRWLNAHLALRNAAFSSGGALVEGADWEVRLPTEWEWQWAAQDGTEQREYPWGAWQEGLANTKAAGLEETTAVGMYPAGASSVGALDMCGNVWEWCLSQGQVPHVTLVDKAGGRRALRGGSFDNRREYASSSFRYHYFYPRNAVNHLGFRVGLSPPLDPGL
jgi:formylglycine-generating enzyme required for sulfatase activity